MIGLQVVLGSLLILAALAVLWGARRRPAHASFRALSTLVGAVLLMLGVGVIGVYLWALSATDTSQFARALVWGDSSFGDQDLFPSRSMSASLDPLVFHPEHDPSIGQHIVDAQGTSLEDFLESTDTTAFIVLRGGAVLYEAYFNGSSRLSTQTSFSVAKSFVSTLLGIAIEEGFVGGLDDPVTGYVPELLERDQRFGDITLRHLVTMSSGLSFDEGSLPWADPANTYYGTDLRAAVITKPRIAEPPGMTFHYNDWNVILLGLVLERATAMPVADFMESRLWQPMGADADGSWSLDRDGAGFEKMFVGVNGTAIDFAKLGWLYLNQGRRDEHQVVPADFVAEATRLDTTTDPAPEYQYLWWIDEDRASYYAHGDHGQVIFVDPGAGLVLVRHGLSGNVNWPEFIGDLAEWLEAR